MAKTCCWVLSDGTTCPKPVQWAMVRDDDDRLVRVYDAFCKEHREKADAEDEQDEEVS